MSDRHNRAIALKWMSLLHVGALGVQILAALALLAGENVLALHSRWAWGVMALAVLQSLAALYSARKVLFGGAVVVLGLEAMQLWLGLDRRTAWHALNALAVWALSLTIAIQASSSLSLPAPSKI